MDRGTRARAFKSPTRQGEGIATMVSIASTGCFALVQLLLTSPNDEHQGAREGRQHRLCRDTEEVGVECHIDQSAWQEQPGGTYACDLAGRH
jgi:hypothetical protein